MGDIKVKFHHCTEKRILIKTPYDTNDKIISKMIILPNHLKNIHGYP